MDKLVDGEIVQMNAAEELEVLQRTKAAIDSGEITEDDVLDKAYLAQVKSLP